MRVIGFAGYSRSGKTHCSRYMKSWCEKHGYNPIEMSFSSVPVGANVPMKVTHEQRQEELTVLFQNLKEEEKENYAKLCKYDLESEFKETIIIIDDVSFLDDIGFLKKHGGYCCFVDASSRIEVPTIKTVSDHLARSVTHGKYPLTLFNRIIDNNGTQKQTRKILEYVIPNLICE